MDFVLHLYVSDDRDWTVIKMIRKEIEQHEADYSGLDDCDKVEKATKKLLRCVAEEYL